LAASVDRSGVHPEISGNIETVRRLLLFRHAKAQRPEPGMEDRVRVLVERGRKDSAKIGAYMATSGLVPDRVLISPSARTQETWKFTASAFSSTPTAVAAEQLYEATPRAIVALIKEAPSDAHTLLVIGHNPELHELALMLVASGNADARKLLQDKLPTAGLVIMDFAFDDWRKLHQQSGRLEHFVTPKLLEVASN
jgi:phosphohistidine phosphatase